jgi:endonuclease/exonuclease/phosphatase (EEP) superfamily protein YafD
MIFLVVPALILALGSLAGFAGGWIWWLDVLANFRPQYFVVLTVLGVAILFAARWRWAGYFVFGVAAINFAFVAPLYLASPGEIHADRPGLRIISFNLLSSNEEYAAVIDYIRSADADLVFLHEASRPWEAAISQAGLDYEFIRARSDDIIFGTIVLARDEVEAVSYGFAETQPRAVGLTYFPDNWPVSVDVLSVHTHSPTTRDRAALRDAQLDFAAGWAADREGAYLVVGDLNATPWSAPFRHLVSAGHLQNSQSGFGLQPSFPVDQLAVLRVPIDHLVHSDVLSVRDRKLGPDLGSDHFPLLVEVQYDG